MMNKKNIEYALAGVLALYVVFFTRPAPVPVVTLLSSSVAQIAALAVVIYVGSTYSLLVAVVLALAVVMSVPAREHLENKTKPAAAEAPAAPAAPDVPAVASKPAMMKPKRDGKEATKPASPPPAEAEPAPGASKVVSTTPGSGSEKFSLMDSAPF